METFSGTATNCLGSGTVNISGSVQKACGSGTRHGLAVDTVVQGLDSTILKIFFNLNNPVIVNYPRINCFLTGRSCKRQASALSPVRADPVEAPSSGINI